MRVKITEKKLRDAGYDLREGDTLTVPAAVGREWCEQGWAEDESGEVKTGERRVEGAALKPAKGRHTARTTNRGG